MGGAECLVILLSVTDDRLTESEEATMYVAGPGIELTITIIIAVETKTSRSMPEKKTATLTLAFLCNPPFYL